jgi:two-component system sensor histidine kinase RegB
MPDSTAIQIVRPASLLRLDTLVRLRWLAVAGQAVTILIVHAGLGYPMPFLSCFAVVAASAALNAALRWRFPVSHRLGEQAATVLLAFDILQLAALLYLTGGLENPFSMLFLAPVMISAAALPPWRTLMLGVLAMTAASALVFVHWPLPWSPDEPMALPFLYRMGIWFALLLGLAFIGVYAWRVTEEARLLAQALAATELILAREQHLSALDGLAAAAAHELGTPLATIALVAKELRHNGPKEGPMAEDVSLLNEQVDRCRGILRKLTSLSNESEGPLETMRLSHLLEEIAGPQRPFDVDIAVTTEGPGAEPVCRRNPGILYGLGNLVENAVDFASDRVVIAAKWSLEEVHVTIRDDGPGFPSEVMSRLGEPYVTTRGVGRDGRKEPGQGMGLGLFIAKTLLERSGARIHLGNATDGSPGAVVRVVWPRLAFERGLVARAEPLEPAFPL